MGDDRGVEANAVVALAGGAVRDGVGALAPRDGGEALADQRAPERRGHEVAPLVGGVGPQRREDVVAQVRVAQILDDDAGGAAGDRPAPDVIQRARLAEVRAVGDDLGAVALAQPRQRDGGVQPAGIRQNDPRRNTTLHWPAVSRQAPLLSS